MIPGAPHAHLRSCCLPVDSPEDPQAFLENVRDQRVVLDEIHRLANPSELLKIAADYYPDTKIVATGSSTLGASGKFRDTLTGRKAELWLTPMVARDAVDFGNERLEHRLLHGGLPPFFMADPIPERNFQEWMEAYWARDIQELFTVERRFSFQRFVELLIAQSGGIFEATSFAKRCEVTRPTITNYLKILEATHVAHVIRPFSSRRRTEIVAAPKVYAFDTGFTCYHRGWSDLRRQDLGQLWEQFVLNELHAHLQTRDIRYWRNKRGQEVDFVMVRRGRPPIALECKWSADEFQAGRLSSFWRQYPESDLIVVAQDVDRQYARNFNGMEVRLMGLSDLTDYLGANLTGDHDRL